MLAVNFAVAKFVGDSDTAPAELGEGSKVQGDNK